MPLSDDPTADDALATDFALADAEDPAVVEASVLVDANLVPRETDPNPRVVQARDDRVSSEGALVIHDLSELAVLGHDQAVPDSDAARGLPDRQRPLPAVIADVPVRTDNRMVFSGSKHINFIHT